MITKLYVKCLIFSSDLKNKWEGYFNEKRTRSTGDFGITAGVIAVIAISAAIFGTGAAVKSYVSAKIATLPYFIVGFFYYILAVVSYGLAKTSIWLLQLTTALAQNQSYTNPGRNEVIATGLDITVPLVNMILVMALIFIALTTILRLKEYDTKKLLVRFFIIALLVNFSHVICGLAVDAANILMGYFLKGAGTAGSMDIADKIWNSSACVYTKLGDQEACLNCFVEFMTYAVMFVTYLLFALVFLIRLFVIWILVILSPIAFALAALPWAYAQKYWNEWKGNFITWTTTGIVASFFLYIGLSFAEITTKIGPTKGADAFGQAFFLGFITIVFLLIAFITTLKSTKAVTGIMGAALGGAVLGKALAVAKFPASKAASAVGRRIREGVPLSDGRRLGLRESANWIAQTGEKSAITRWMVPDALRKYGQSRVGVEAAQKDLAAFSSGDLMRRVMVGDLYGERAAAATVEVMKRGDSQDIIREFRKKYKGTGKMTDEQIIKDERFKGIMKRPLDIAQRSGMLGSNLLRSDPRLARLKVMFEKPLTDKKAIADRNKEILNYAQLKGIKGANPGTGIASFSTEQIENIKEEMAIRDIVKDVKPSNIQNFEKEVLDDEALMTFMLGHGRDHFTTMGSGVKRGVETGQKTINNIYTRWAVQKGYNDITASTPAAQDEFKQYIMALNSGRAGFFDALSDPRMKSQGWAGPEFDKDFASTLPTP